MNRLEFFKATGEPEDARRGKENISPRLCDSNVHASVRPSVRTERPRTKGPKDKKTIGPRTTELRNYETTGSETEEVRGQSWLGLKASYSQRELTGNCGKRGNKWEKLGNSDPRVGNRGKEWEILGSMNWINGAILDRKSRRKRGGTEIPSGSPGSSVQASVRPYGGPGTKGPKAELLCSDWADGG